MNEDWISDGNQADDALSALWSSPHARRVLDSMSELFIAFDRDLCVVFANRALIERSREHRGELVGRHLLQVWPEMEGSTLEDTLVRVLRTGASESFEYRYAPSDTWIEADAHAAGGYLHVYFRDVTDRKKVEAEHARREAALEEILAALPHIAWTTDARGVPVYVNPRWREYTGLATRAIEDFRNSIHPEDLARVIEANAAARARSETAQYRLRLRRHDGEYRWFEVRSSPLPEGPGPARSIGTSTDVHEEHLAQQALRESETRLASIVENVGDAFFALDHEYRFVVFNPQAERFLGVKKEAVLGRNCWEAFPGSVGSEMERCIREAMETRQPHQRELHFPKTGKWVELQVYPWPDGVILFERDTTARREAELALRESEARLRAIFENATVGVGEVDTVTKRFTRVNPTFCRMLGYPEEEVVGRSPWDFSHPDDLGVGVVEMSELAAGKRDIATWERRFVRRDDSVVTLLVGVTRLGSAGSLPIRNVCMFTDVSELKEAENRLRQSEHRQRFLLQLGDAVQRETSAAEVVRVACRRLGEELQVARCGYAVVYSEEDRFVVEHDYAQGVPSITGSYRLSDLSEAQRARYFGGEPIVVPDTAVDPVTAPHYERLYAPNQIRSTATVPLLRNGTWVASFALQHHEPRTWEENEIRLLRESAARVWDAIERVRAERSVREANENLERSVEARTAELQAANQQLEGFTYHVSHDLRGPLRAIVSTSHMVLEDFGDDLPPEGRALLVSQTKAAGKMARLMDDLLKLSRLARQAIDRQPIDLTQLAIEATGEARFIHPDTAVDVVVADGLTTFADPRLVKLALSNLIENAVKYSPHGGTVTVGQRADGAYFVADQGIGIDEKYFAKIFEPFERLHREEEFQGTGVGLANVRQIIARHGGHIWVESEVGKGSAFFFTL
ncbi:MAG: PAS domain-containing sensor histidine kinase [Fimbriimonas sp.]